MIRWGIIGLGNIAARFAASLSHSERGYLYAVGSRSVEKCEVYQKQYKGCIGYQSYDKLLEDAKVDVVYIALPPGLHLTWVIKALQHGKAVLCEKPSAITENEIRQMVQQARDSKAFFMEAMKARFTDCFKAVQTELEQGVIGEIQTVSASFCANVEALADRKSSYYYDGRQGGTLLDMSPYPVAFCMSLLGNEPEKVESQITLDKNGIDHHVSFTLIYQRGQKGYGEVAFDEDKERIAIITGSKGTIELPYYYRGEQYTIRRRDGIEQTRSYPLKVDDMFDEIEEVHRCLAAGLLESSSFCWEDSIAQMRILDKIRASV